MSRIQKENERYLARVQASMDAEHAASRRRQQEREERQAQRDEQNKLREEEKLARRMQREAAADNKAAYEQNITERNVAYGNFWVNSAGAGIQTLVLAVKNGEEPSLADRAVRVKVYDSKQRKIDTAQMLDLVKAMQCDDFPEITPVRGQMRWHADTHVSATIYEHVRNVWHNTMGSSLC